jgi:hypothetical protein
MHILYYNPGISPRSIYTGVQLQCRHCTALHCTALHCTALHCTALHCTTTALQCNVLPGLGIVTVHGRTIVTIGFTGIRNGDHLAISLESILVDFTRMDILFKPCPFFDNFELVLRALGTWWEPIRGTCLVQKIHSPNLEDILNTSYFLQCFIGLLT